MFVYSLPLFFSAMDLAGPLELLLILLALCTVLLISAPNYEAGGLSPGGNFLFAAWSGKAALMWVFWPFFMLLNAGLYAADTLAKMGMLTVSSWDDVHLMFMLPIIWWAVAVWRCSANTPVKLGAALARLMTGLVFFEYGLKLVIRIDYPRIFFGCEELLLDYGSCF